jgi:hypothetical protein
MKRVLFIIELLIFVYMYILYKLFLVLKIIFSSFNLAFQ